jgi:hypothetical protein
LAKLLPYENYIIESPLTADQVLLKLLEKTLSSQEYVSESDKHIFSFGLKAWSKPYWGYIRNDSFELERLINYRNLGNPKIFGVLKPIVSGTSIQIRMRPRGFVIAFVGFALMLCLYALISSIAQSVKADQVHAGVIIASGMLIFVYLLLLVAFKAEATRSKRFLSDLFANAKLSPKP